MATDFRTNLKGFDNSWYYPGRNAIVRFFWYYTNALFINTSLITSSFIKCNILRLFGAKIGKQVIIKPSVNIKYPWRLTIGDYSWIGENVWIDNLDDVFIGPNVCISQGAMLLCGNHNYKKETFDLTIAPITIEEGVWIGAKAIVCPGVKCLSHSILSVNSVATKDIEAFSVYQGNPAVKVKNRL
jgi:putative colanic acid biosynthesis acetyltransferase WcaF